VAPEGSFSDQVARLLDRIEYRRADSAAQREAIFRLRYQAYMRDGTIAPSADRMFSDPYDDRGNVYLFGLYLDGAGGQDGRKVIWVGTPNARDDAFTQRLAVLRQAYQQEAAKRPNVTLIDTWAMFQSPNGGYADFIVDDDGEAKLMRQDDGFHLNLDGANKLARAIEAEIEKDITARGGNASAKGQAV
jgi:hypothetical protein